MDFCRSNEAMIWEYLLGKDLLFSTETGSLSGSYRRGSFYELFYRGVTGRAVCMDRVPDH
jgi:hypothetical protein